jgi:PhnB protein
MQQFIPYLAFDGNCAEVMRFYQQVLGGTLEVMTHGQSPYAEHTPKEHHGRVLHARLKLPDGNMLYAGDIPAGMPYAGIHGATITMSFGSVAEAERVFQAFAEGGRIDMPLAETFWAKRFGMVTDRHGCPWAINGAQTDFNMPS